MATREVINNHWLHLDNEQIRRQMLSLFAKFRPVDGRAVPFPQLNDKSWRYLLAIAAELGFNVQSFSETQFPTDREGLILYSVQMQHSTYQPYAESGAMLQLWSGVGYSREEALARLLGIAMNIWQDHPSEYPR